MKSLVLILFLVIFSHSFSQLKAYLDTKQFYDPQIGNYVEIYMQFVSSSIKYEAKTEGLQGKVAIRLTVSQKDSSYFSDVYILESPIMKDSIVEDFYDEDVEMIYLEVSSILFSCGYYQSVIKDLNFSAH